MISDQDALLSILISSEVRNGDICVCVCFNLFFVRKSATVSLSVTGIIFPVCRISLLLLKVRLG